MPGYSATPLVKKLGLKAGMRAIIRGAPDGDRAYFAALGPDAKQAIWLTRPRQGLDFVHAFHRRRAALRRQLRDDLPRMHQNGMLWVSWPKKSSGFISEISEDVVRAEALPLGLVDIKVCAFDETWSCLKLVIRRELRT